MTHKERSDATTSGQLGPKRRVWGGSPTSRFSQTGRKAGLVKMASVATEALLATMVLVLRSSQPVSYTDAQT